MNESPKPCQLPDDCNGAAVATETHVVRQYLIYVVLVLSLAMAVRVVAAVVWQAQIAENQRFVWGDSGTYWEIAENWMQEAQYPFGQPPQKVFRTPGYPALLTLGMQVGAWTGYTFTPFHARLMGCFLGTLAVWLLIGWTVDLTGDQRVGLIAGALMAIEPGAISMSVFLLAEAAFIPLLVLSLWSWTVAWRQKNLISLVFIGLMTGVITGAAILVRPSWLLFAPLVCGLAFLCYNQRPKQIALGIAVALGISLSMMPWWYRNYQLTGRWVPTTLQVGASLYDGWNPQADGSSDMTHGYAATRPLFLKYRQQVEGHIADRDYDGFQQAALELEIANNDYLQQAAIQWGRENPVQLSRLFFIKIWRTWRPWPEANEVNSWLLTTISVLSFVPLMLLAIVGAWRHACRDFAWGLCVWPAIYVTLLHGVFVGSLRYRQPAMIPLIVLSAVVICAMLVRRRAYAASRVPSNEHCNLKH